ncbi:MAG TPA: hypothetical protein VIY72_07345 [Acidimicrobiales bacterium]
MDPSEGWRPFFEELRDAFEGFAADAGPYLHTTSHSRGCKAWFGDETREHYEAQLVRIDDGVVLEIGFHAEHRDPTRNAEVLTRLTGSLDWRAELGPDAEAGDFLGNTVWQRISEVWPDPDADPELAIDAAARLADYARVIEPARQSPA